MEKWKIIAIIPAIIFFGIAFFYPTLFKFKSPIIETAVIIGLIVFIIISFFLYKSKKIFLYLMLGLVLTAAGYGIVFLQWLQSYPLISMFILTIVVLLSIIFLGISGFKMFKDLFYRLKK